MIARLRNSSRRAGRAALLTAVLLAMAARAAGAQVAFVANQLSDDVSIVDTRAHAAVGGLAPGPRPSAVLLSPIGRYAYIATADPSDDTAGVIHIVDAATLQPLGDVPLDGSPRALAASPDGGELFAITSGPPGTDDGHLVLVDVIAARAGAGAAAIDASVPTGGEPGGLALDPGGRFVYVTNAVFSPGNVVFVVDLALVIATPESAVVDSITVGNVPLGIAVTADGHRAYVANFAFGSNQVSVVDLDERTVLRNVKVGSRPAGVAISPDGRLVFVSNLISDTVSVIDSGTNRVKATIDVGHAPQALAFTAGGEFLYVANRQSVTIPTPGDVSVIDPVLAISAPASAVVTTADVGDNPIALATAPDSLEALTDALFSPVVYTDADVNEDVRIGAADVIALLRPSAPVSAPRGAVR